MCARECRLRNYYILHPYMSRPAMYIYANNKTNTPLEKSTVIYIIQHSNLGSVFNHRWWNLWWLIRLL